MGKGETLKMFSSPCIWVQGLIESKNSSALKAWFCANNLLNTKIRNAVPGVWLLHIIAEWELAPRCASSKVHPLGIVCFCQHMEVFPWRFTDSLWLGRRGILGCSWQYCWVVEIAEKRFPCSWGLGSLNLFEFYMGPSALVRLLCGPGSHLSWHQWVILCLDCNSMKVTGHKVISKIFIHKHWFNLRAFWCRTQPSQFLSTSLLPSSLLEVLL